MNQVVLLKIPEHNSSLLNNSMFIKATERFQQHMSQQDYAEEDVCRAFIYCYSFGLDFEKMLQKLRDDPTYIPIQIDQKEKTEKRVQLPVNNEQHVSKCVYKTYTAINDYLCFLSIYGASLFNFITLQTSLRDRLFAAVSEILDSELKGLAAPSKGDIEKSPRSLLIVSEQLLLNLLKLCETFADVAVFSFNAYSYYFIGKLYKLSDKPVQKLLSDILTPSVQKVIDNLFNFSLLKGQFSYTD